MRATCSVFIAISLDGFIARADGSIDWLGAANARVPAGEDCGYAEFMSGIDAMLMGRHTFELARSFGNWPYGSTPVIVLSSTMAALPAGTPDSVSLASAPPAAMVSTLSGQGVRRVYVDGGVTIQRFFGAGLIDDLTITTIPVLIGAGRPLFGPLAADVRLEHQSTRAFDFGFVQSRYRVVRRR